MWILTKKGRRDMNRSETFLLDNVLEGEYPSNGIVSGTASWNYRALNYIDETGKLPVWGEFEEEAKLRQFKNWGFIKWV